jgi:deoxyhypusine synthase
MSTAEFHHEIRTYVYERERTSLPMSILSATGRYGVPAYSSATGGLSGAASSEAVNRRKIDSDKLPDTVVAYLDSTIGMPILTSNSPAKRKPRKLKRLHDRHGPMMVKLRQEAEKHHFSH